MLLFRDGTLAREFASRQVGVSAATLPASQLVGLVVLPFEFDIARGVFQHGVGARIERGNPLRPSGLVAVSRMTSSARLSTTSREPTCGPPSLKTRVNPRLERASSAAPRSTRPSGSAAIRSTSTPRARRSASRSALASGVVRTRVGHCAAVAHRREAAESRRRESSTTRSGFRSRPGRRTVSSGSSSIAVPTPTMIASCIERRTCTRKFEASPVMVSRRSC